MFDFGVGELGLIAVVGLLVLGPERLPRVARTAGALLRKARQSWQGVRADIERELAAEDLKQSIRQTMHAVDPTPELNRGIGPLQPPAKTPSSVVAPDPGAAGSQPDEH